MGRRSLWAVVVVLAGCAHKPLSGGELDTVQRPALFARIDEQAGPRSHVFRYDDTWAPKLKKLEPKEADRRLARNLADGFKKEKDGQQVLIAPSISRFEVADTLRAETLHFLPREAPWTRTVGPAEVASALEAFLVDEVPANVPDYERLVPLGIDWVVEIVVEEYGLRSEKGQVGTFLVGRSRMFKVGGGEAYYRRFYSDDLRAGLPGLDPFEVAKNPGLFRDRFKQMLVSVAEQVAKDLSPADRRSGPALKEERSAPSSDETSPQGEDTGPKKFKRAPPPEDPL